MPRQALQDLVDRYLAASNARDLDAVFELFHPGVAYYDAFWRETCVGGDFRQYLADWFTIDELVYEQTGELIIVDDESVGLRYSARDENGTEVYAGAEVLALKDGMILTISDYYCDPSELALEEVVALSVKRHGAPKYASSGLSAAQRSQVRRQISELLNAELMHLDAELTVHRLAQKLRCTPGQLFSVLITDFHLDIEDKLPDRHWMLARDLFQDVTPRSG